MSGIEAVGIVLAGLPILADGIDKYIAAVSRTKRIFQPSRELRSFKAALQVEIQILHNTCERLLAEITHTEAETQALLLSPGGVGWETPELESQLRAFLGTSYETFCGILAGMREAIGRVQDDLSMSTTLDRMQFAFGTMRLETLLHRVRDGNTSLRRLVRQNLELEPIRTHKRRRARRFTAIRQEASALFAMLDQSLQCQCRPQHSLFLCLEPIVHGKESDGRHFVLALDSAKLAALETTTASIIPSVQQVAAQQLCQAIAIGPKDTYPKKLSLGPSSNSASVAGQEILINTVCLGAVTRFHSSDIAIHGRERRRLALTVAASVLKLYRTPWVSEQWVRNYISFAGKHGGPRSASPLIEGSLVPQQAATQALTQNDTIRLTTVRSESLFALGIFLIELCFKKSFADLQAPGDRIAGGMLECLTEFRTAMRLIPEVYDEAGQRYGDAVRRCIRCDFDHKTYDLDNEEFCQAVYEGVVVPLEEDVKLIDGPEALAECASGFRLV